MARLDALRAIMARYGDGNKPVWATEMGWTVEGQPGSEWQTVSEQQQAEYLVRAFELAPERWPWLEMLAVWKLQTGAESEWEGFNLLDAAREPRAAYRALQELFGKTPAAAARAPAPRQDRYQVLARDEVVHLGDADFNPPWRPLYGAVNPSTAWSGTVYVRAPGDDAWTLTLRMMQSNMPGNHVWVNGVRLDPAFPPEDFSDAWVTLSWPVPSGALREGANEVRVTLGTGLLLTRARPLNQDDLQVKDIVLRRTGR
jgi:hypothetical protein